jgi:selenocysteine lyase/cysteine desulfurase
MVTMELPPGVHVGEFKHALYDKYLVEIPILELEGRKYARASLQAYNDEKDLERLLDGLATLLSAGGGEAPFCPVG